MQPPKSPTDLVIRTMKDDTSDMHPVSVVSHTPRNVFPLPVKQEQKQSTTLPSKKKWNLVLGVAYILLFLALAAGGWYGYMWWTSHQAPVAPTEVKRSLAEMIPKEAMAVVAYTLDSDSRRTGVKLLWDGKGVTEVGHAVDGDPRELLPISDISGAYYIVLQDNPRPFLLLEKTPSSEEYVATQSDVVPKEKEGWYIINRLGADAYTTALERGTFAEQGGVPAVRLPSSVAQYVLAAPYVSKLFNDMASDGLGTSRIAATTFEIEAPSQDGTIRAQAAIPIAATPETVLPSLKELKTLVPGDVDFGKIGGNFAQDMTMWQQETARLDGTIIEQPAVRQFLSIFTTPYTFFQRTGSDGVRDIGLVIQLPAEFQKSLTVGDQIIEQALPAFIPLVVGRVVNIHSAFHDAMYEHVPIRYTNITGQTQALDYTVGDSFILISSSREGMGTLADVALGKGGALEVHDPWKTLFEKSTTLAEGTDMFLGRIKDPLLLSLLPVPTGISKFPVGVVSKTTSTERILHATILVQQ